MADKLFYDGIRWLLGRILAKKKVKKEKKPQKGKKVSHAKGGVGFDLLGGGGGLLSDILTTTPTKAAPPAKPEAEEETPAEKAAPFEAIAVTAPKIEKPTGEGKVLDKYKNVEILSVKEETTPFYKVRVPEINLREQELLKKVKDLAVEEIKIPADKADDPAEMNRLFTQGLFKILERESRGQRIPPGRLRELGEVAVHDMIGFGLLDPLLADDQLEDIMVTSVGKPVYVYHRKFGMCYTNIVFYDDDSIKYLIDKMARIVGRRIDQQAPLLDARLQDGSRVNATIPPVSLDGPTISIRKFRKDPLTVVDIINYGTVSTDFAAFLWLAVDGLGVKPANILIAGGTGSGKTTTLNAASNFVPAQERIISIEDTAELQLPHKHWIRMETRPPNVEGRGEITMDDLVKNTLRMRPDRMVVGEVRGSEARTLFTAMNTGHDGAVANDSKIQLSSGEIIQIEDLASKLFSNGKVRKDGNFEYADVDGPEVKTLNEKTLKLEDKNIIRVWRKPYRGKLLEIRTSDGRKITVTKDHPFYIMGKKLQSQNLRKGDCVASPLFLQTSAKGENSLAYLAGYVAGDGCMTDNNVQIVEGDRKLFGEVLAEMAKHTTHKITSLDYGSFRRGEVWDSELVQSIKGFARSDPGSLDEEYLSSYLAGLFDAESHVNLHSRGIEFANKSKDIVESIQQLLLRFGVHSSLSLQEHDGKGNAGPYYKLLVYGEDDLKRFLENIRLRSKKKGEKLLKLAGDDASYNDVIPNVGAIIKDERLKAGLTQTELAQKMGVLSRSNIPAYERGVRNPRRKNLIKMAEVLDSEVLKTIAVSEIFWVKVKSVEEVEYNGYVFDFTVDGNHNYIANGVVVSNCMGTVHANSAAETVSRLTEPPMSVPAIMIPALDLIVMQNRIYHRQKGQLRRTTEVAEVTGVEGSQPQLSRIFKWNARTDSLDPTGVPSKIKRTIAEFSGMSGHDIEIEIEKRAAVLEWMKKQNIRNIQEVGRIIQEYYRDPESIMKRVKAEKGRK